MPVSDPDEKRSILAWLLFDFANQPFTTLVVTFVYATFFTQVIAADEVTGTTQWSWGIAITALIVAITSPYLGALADRGGHRKRFLFITVVACIFGSVLLFFPTEGEVLFALTALVIANVAFELSYVFYNAFLPEIAPPDKIGRISGYGWAVGYLGGLLSLVAALLIFVFPEPPLFGLNPDTGANIRATNLMVAVWYALFAIPLFLFVKERKRTVLPNVGGLIRSTNAQLRTTFREIRQFKHAFYLLAARFFYNDGIVTVFAFGGIYAAGTFGFDQQGILIFGIVLNVAAGLGAFLFGFVDDRIGGKRTIMITLAGLMVAVALATLATSVVWFWVAGILLGLLVGPNQASSRSLLGRFTPQGKANEFFGFFAFSGKLTAFAGPIVLGWVTSLAGSQRVGVATIIIFFVIGAVLLMKVDEAEGIANARAADPVIPAEDT
ncbi:MAG: MFS transporter [Bacteroidetes bacterium]|nr:MFS transporter [Bacteroidota bacterium]